MQMREGAGQEKLGFFLYTLLVIGFGRITTVDGDLRIPYYNNPNSNLHN